MGVLRAVTGSLLAAREPLDVLKGLSGWRSKRGHQLHGPGEFPESTNRAVVFGQEGYFLATVLILTAAVIMMAAGLATVATGTMRMAQRNLDRARALYAAESGMNRAIYAVVRGEVKPDKVSGWEIRDQQLPPSATYSVWFPSQDESCPGRTVVAEGSSNGVTRRFRARVRLTSLPFPPPPLGPEVSTAGCEDDYADVSLTLTPIDEISPPRGWKQSCNPAKITGDGPIYIRCDGDMELRDLNIEATGEVNIFVRGDLWVGSAGWLFVAPGARVKFHVYGNVILGKCESDIIPLFCELDKLFGSRLTVTTEDDVIFHVQKGLISNPGAVVKVSPHQPRHTPGAVVFLMSSAPEYTSEPVEIGPTEAILDAQIRTLLCEDQPFAELLSWLCEGSATELAVYAPSRTVTTNSMSIRWNVLRKTIRMHPYILGAIVRREGREGCVTYQDKNPLQKVLRGGKIEPNCEQGHQVDYNDRLRHFQLWRPSRLVLGSWREERLTP